MPKYLVINQRQQIDAGSGPIIEATSPEDAAKKMAGEWGLPRTAEGPATYYVVALDTVELHPEIAPPPAAAAIGSGVTPVA